MANKNLGMVIAETAVTSISSLNNSPTKSIELWEKIRLSQEENDEVASQHKYKALWNGAGAIGCIALSIIGESFKQKALGFGEPVIAVGKACPEIAKGISSIHDGSITHYSHLSRVHDTASQRITHHEGTTESLIGRNVEQIGRLIAKEI